MHAVGAQVALRADVGRAPIVKLRAKQGRLGLEAEEEEEAKANSP